MKPGRIILFITDSLSITVAFCVSLFLRQSPLAVGRIGSIQYNVATYLTSYAIGLILLMAIFGAYKLYQIREIELSARIFTVLKASFAWLLVITACVYALKYDFSRWILFATVILATILICLGRYSYFRYRQNKKRRDNSGDDILIIGTGNRAKDIEKQIKSQLPNLSVVRLDYGNPETLAYLASMESDDIFIADECLAREQVMEILADASLNHHTFRVILDTFRLATGEVRLNDLDEIPSISVSCKPNSAYLAAKRLTDVVISGMGLIAACPFWLAIAAIIKLDSDGPVLIKQSRIGSNLKPFTLIKFRTMHCNATLYDYAPGDLNDSRITRCGRILRHFSLDELPQLWNILKGDMSLVGPRPEMEFIVKKYEPWQKTRLKAKPGLTGLWQILGRKDIPLHKNLEYDFYYVCNRSALLDSVILLKTIPAVLFGRGAY